MFIFDYIVDKYRNLHERVMFYISYSSGMEFISPNGDHVYFDYYSFWKDIVHVTVIKPWSGGDDEFFNGEGGQYQDTITRFGWELNYEDYLTRSNS